jgi:hypothetical protein
MAKKQIMKMLGAGAVGVAGGAAVSELTEPDAKQEQFTESLKAFHATFPQLPGNEAQKLHKVVWDKYQLHSDQLETKYLLEGASSTQQNKYSSLAKLGFRRNQDA